MQDALVTPAYFSKPISSTPTLTCPWKCVLLCVQSCNYPMWVYTWHQLGISWVWTAVSLSCLVSWSSKPSLLGIQVEENRGDFRFLVCSNKLCMPIIEYSYTSTRTKSERANYSKFLANSFISHMHRVHAYLLAQSKGKYSCLYF